MKNRKAIILVSLILFLFILVGCDFLGLGNKLIGTWRWSSGSYWEEITFKEDESLTISGYASTGLYLITGTYTTTSSTLTITYDTGYEVSVDYTVTGDTLELTSDGISWEYTKQ